MSAVECSQAVVAIQVIQLILITLLVIFTTVSVEQICYYRRLIKSFRRAMDRQSEELRKQKRLVAEQSKQEA